MPLVLQVKDLSVSFRLPGGDIQAVSNLDFSLWGGETLVILGESGSGKSQALLGLMGLLAPNGQASGSVLYGETDLLALPPLSRNRYRGRHLTLILQNPGIMLNPFVAVGTQMAEVLHVHHAVPMRQAELAAIDMLEMIGIPDPELRAAAFPAELSGGMQQRVAVGMALMCRPHVLLADEPTGALDAMLQVRLLDLLRTVVDELGTGVVLVTRHLGVAAASADRILVMHAGEAVELAPPDELFHEPRHPYTRALLAAAPGRALPRAPLPVPAGSSATPGAARGGCRFHQRCPHCVPQCREQAPSWRVASGTHWVRCHFDLAAEGRPWM